MLEREREEPRGSEHRSNHEAPEHRSNERDRNEPRQERGREQRGREEERREGDRGRDERGRAGDGDREQREEREKEEKEKEMNLFKKNMSPPTIMAVPFLALNHYDRLFMILYLAIAIALLGYKNTVYPLPPYAVACQGTILVMLALTQLMRYVLAERAVSEKQSKMVVVYLVTTVFVILSFVFELRLQTYVVMAELITNWIGLGFVICQVICGIWVLKVLTHKKGTR